MNIDDWAGRWSAGRIGFHEGHPNAFLEANVAKLGHGRRVLVPLCGKSEDLAFLALAGHVVVGIEAVEDAVRAFFSEHGLKPEVLPGAPHGDGKSASTLRYRAGRITLLVGDVFGCAADDVGPVDAFYDRAALVALPPGQREPYVRHLRSLLAPASPGLVVVFEYPPGQMEGPPFSVTESELRTLYAGAKIEALGEAPSEARFRDAGVDAVDRCFSVVV